MTEFGPVLPLRRFPGEQQRLQWARRSGLLTAVLPGIYVPAHLAGLPNVRLAAAVLYLPDGVILGSAAAAASFWSTRPFDRIEIAARCTRQHPLGFDMQRVKIPQEHRVPAPAWTQLQAGLGWLCSPALNAVLMSESTDGESIFAALRSRLVTPEALLAALADIPSRRGNPGRKRRIVRAQTNPWSAAEALAHKVFRSGGLTGWTANHPVACEGNRYFVDIAFRECKLAIEIDGRQFHDRTPSEFESERLRSLRLAKAGWTVLRITYWMLVNRPEEVLASVRAVLRRLTRAAH
ncbi:DUF559 domain-containing protein [Nakamurella aerolata]|uniref:DUF559 domain-containing protein n=1 Tax=Nakamurella aerolata TaxID=1656892 RepID=A0A849A1V0_9ACTN|nr:DUF559 domain-containing protein [Nakamurella aerolata]